MEKLRKKERETEREGERKRQREKERERGRKNNQSKLGQSKQSPGVDKERPPNRFQLLSQRKPIITKQKRSNEQVSLRFTSKETFFLDVQQRHHHRHQLLLLFCSSTNSK